MQPIDLMTLDIKNYFTANQDKNDFIGQQLNISSILLHKPHWWHQTKFFWMITSHIILYVTSFSTLSILLCISNTFIFDKTSFAFVCLLGKSRVLLCDLKLNPQIKFYSEFPSYDSKFYIRHLFISFIYCHFVGLHV